MSEPSKAMDEPRQEISAPIRVAQILNRMDSGGIEAVVMNYYRHIDRSKVQFDFYFAEDSSFPQREELLRLGAGIYPIPPYTKVFAYHNALYNAFQQRAYRIVHAQLSTMSIFPLFAAWRAKVPVRICHSHSTANWREGKKTLLKYILRPLNKIFATEYFACGESAGRWMYGERCFNAGKVIVVPNAIDTKKFLYNPQVRVQLRKELGIPQDAFVVGHVGRFVYPKNHKFLMEVFAELKKMCPNARLLLIGEGELWQMIKNQGVALEINNSVIFTGPRQDVNKLYSVMDVFCLPSLYEGMPVVAWEAQVNGLQCVFSSAIGYEAKKSKNCQFVELRKGSQEWVKELLQKKGRINGEVPEIKTYAYKLQKIYESIENRIG